MSRNPPQLGNHITPVLDLANREVSYDRIRPRGGRGCRPGLLGRGQRPKGRRLRLGRLGLCAVSSARLGRVHPRPRLEAVDERRPAGQVRRPAEASVVRLALGRLAPQDRVEEVRRRGEHAQELGHRLVVARLMRVAQELPARC
jgi:hypothetical protein